MKGEDKSSEIENYQEFIRTNINESISEIYLSNEKNQLDYNVLRIKQTFIDFGKEDKTYKDIVVKNELKKSEENYKRISKRL
jgi:hypothetical protein